MFIGTLFSDRVDRDNPIDLRFHRNLETSTRKFLEIHLKLSESENADRAIGNQISDINLEMLPKKILTLFFVLQVLMYHLIGPHHGNLQ